MFLLVPTEYSLQNQLLVGILEPSLIGVMLGVRPVIVLVTGVATLSAVPALDVAPQVATKATTALQVVVRVVLPAELPVLHHERRGRKQTHLAPLQDLAVLLAVVVQYQRESVLMVQLLVVAVDVLPAQQHLLHQIVIIQATALQTARVVVPANLPRPRLVLQVAPTQDLVEHPLIVELCQLVLLDR